MLQQKPGHKFQIPALRMAPRNRARFEARSAFCYSVGTTNDAKL